MELRAAVGVYDETLARYTVYTSAWAAIGVILLAPRADHAYDAAIVYMLGTGLAVAFAVGTKIIQLRRVALRLNLQSELDAALESIVWGESAAAVSRLAALDKTLATRPGAAALRGPRQDSCDFGGA